MLKKIWARIDRFYPVLVIVVVLLTALMVVTIKSIWGAFNLANNTNAQIKAIPRLETEKVTEAYEKANP